MRIIGPKGRRLSGMAGTLCVLAVVAAPLLSAGASRAADPSAGCATSAGVTTCVFAYTGAAQTWTVPTGVTGATFDLLGAQGGGGSAGGEGGRATATLALTPGEQLQLNVGGSGATLFSPAPGGFNGGGSSSATSGGGGASDVRRGAYALADRLLVAGGGGGAGHAIVAGAGGGTTGTGSGGTFDADGGTQTAGGATGGGVYLGTSGQLGVGGNGGVEPCSSLDDCYPGNRAWAGGGGGGYFGGGGGSAGESAFGSEGGNGGGGSGFGPAGTSFQTGVRSGDGLITISYSEPSVPSPPQVGIAPTSIDFGSQQVGSISAPQIVTVTDTAASGSDPLVIGQLSLSGADSAAFGIGSDTCSGATVMPGASCTVNIVFEPMTAGARTASLWVPSNAATSPTDTVGLSGTATPVAPPAALGASPSTVSFGNQLTGSTSTAHTVTITNTAVSGSQSLLLGHPSIAGTNAADFSISGGTCTMASLTPGSTCTIDVRFTPAAAGTRSATLYVPSNAASSPDLVGLTGTGTTVSVADVRVGVSGPTTAASGSQNTYVVNVANAGPSTAANVTLTMQIPTGTKFLSVNTTHGSCTHPSSGATSGTIMCSLGDLVSGGAAINTIALKITLTGKGGTIALAARASSATSDPDQSNNVASLTTTVAKK